MTQGRCHSGTASGVSVDGFVAEGRVDDVDAVAPCLVEAYRVLDQRA